MDRQPRAGMPRPRLAICAAAALVALPATAHAELSSAEVIAGLNALRATHGLPADITEVPEWSHGCRLHNRYQDAVGELSHEQDRAHPASTPEGAEAGASSVLGYGSWADGAFREAPYHYMQLLAPQLARTGASEAHGLICIWTWPGYDHSREAANRLYSVPGDGVTGVSPSERAAEDPDTPGDHVGLPQPAVTGPHLYVMADGPWAALGDDHGARARLIAGSLRGPEGEVEIRTLDNRMQGPAGEFPPGAIMIPVYPLAPRVRYRASATIQLQGTRMTREWSFTTRSLPPPARPRPRAAGLPLTVQQMFVNQRIAQAAIHRVAAIEARIEGRTPPPPPAVDRSRVRLTLGQLRVNHRIGRVALARVRAVERRFRGHSAPTPLDAAPAPSALTPRALLADQRIAQEALWRSAELPEPVPAR